MFSFTLQRYIFILRLSIILFVIYHQTAFDIQKISIIFCSSKNSRLKNILYFAYYAKNDDRV